MDNKFHSNPEVKTVEDAKRLGLQVAIVGNGQILVKKRKEVVYNEDGTIESADQKRKKDWYGTLARVCALVKYNFKASVSLSESRWFELEQMWEQSYPLLLDSVDESKESLEDKMRRESYHDFRSAYDIFQGMESNVFGGDFSEIEDLLERRWKQLYDELEGNEAYLECVRKYEKEHRNDVSMEQYEEEMKKMLAAGKSVDDIDVMRKTKYPDLVFGGLFPPRSPGRLRGRATAELDDDDDYEGLLDVEGGCSEYEWANDWAMTQVAVKHDPKLFKEYLQKKADELFVHSNRCQRLFSRNIRRFDKLKLALNLLKTIRRGPVLNVFGLPKPSCSNDSMRIKQVKQYWVSSHLPFWHYALDEVRPVMLEECVLSSIPMPLFFDIEMKRKETGDVNTSILRGDWKQILSKHVDILGCEVVTCDDTLTRLVQAYSRIVSVSFTDEECSAGLKDVVTFIKRFLESRLHLECNFFVVSGCRSEKLSFHLVTKDLLVDSSVKSMPLLVFEIAREFQKENLASVIRDFDSEIRYLENGDIDVSMLSASFMFRLRALMLFDVVVFNDDGFNNNPEEEQFTFRVVDDSIFDEAVYTTNHLLRAPGCCKPNTSGLHPVTLNCSRMIRKERMFTQIFSPDDAGFALWQNNLVTGPVGDNIKCLVGMTPSPSYPRARSWHSICNQEEIVGIDLSAYETIEYDAPLYKDLRKMIYRGIRRITSEEERNLFHTPTLSEIDNARDIVLPDEIFMADDRTRKPFRLFHPHEVFYHRHGTVEENTPSATVFPGGFQCFGCGRTFIVPRESPFEEPYMFTACQTIVETDPKAYMPDINWKEVLHKKKLAVIDAPMGSGKTEQLKRFCEDLRVSEPGASVLVISFRELLARQQASRLGLVCYKDLDTEALRFGPPLLSICLNSLLRLPAKTYDYMILDECGLIRRHFLSATIHNVREVFNSFKQFMKKAKSIIMLQDGISMQDVTFYTDMLNPIVDSLDQKYVYAQCFRKPIEIHPISMSTNYIHSLVNLVSCYRKSLGSPDLEGKVRSKHPFMVFCTSCVIAEFIVKLLQQEATLQNADPYSIQGVWSQIKDSSPFCKSFGNDPNKAANKIDVIVCTSVIGAGFSIDERFEAFHAFLICGILPFEEERQFIQRLRFVLKYVPENAIRQSYLYIEKGRGGSVDYSKVLSSFATVRRMALGLRYNARKCSYMEVLEENPSLEGTAARIEVERTATMSLHDRLWKDYGTSRLESEFEDANWAITDDEEKEIRGIMNSYMNKRKKDISSHVMTLNLDDLSACASELEISQNFDLMRLADIKNIDNEVLNHFRFPQVWLELLGDKKKRISSKSFRNQLVSQANALIGWLVFIYGQLVPDRLDNMYNVWQQRRSDVGMLKRIAHFILAKEVLFPILSVTAEATKASYLQSGGCLPFMAGAVFVINKKLVMTVEDSFEATESDTTEQREEKRVRRDAYMILMNKGKNTEACFRSLYDCINTKDLLVFIKTIFRKLGLQIESTKKRVQVRTIRYQQYEVKPPRLVFQTGLCLQENSRGRLMELLPILVETDNTACHDKMWINECLKQFDECCIKHKHNVSYPRTQSMPIQQQVGVIKARMKEAAVIHEAGTARIVREYETAGMTDSPDSPVIREAVLGPVVTLDASIPTDVVCPPTIQSVHSESTITCNASFFDEEDMISVEGINGIELENLAHRNLDTVDEMRDLRLLAYASEKVHPDAPVYREKTGYASCRFIDDAADCSEEDEDEDDDDDTDIEIVTMDNTYSDIEDVHSTEASKSGYCEAHSLEDNDDSDVQKKRINNADSFIEADSDDGCSQKVHSRSMNHKRKDNTNGFKRISKMRKKN